MIFLNYGDIIESTIDKGTIIGIGTIFTLAILMFYKGFYHKYKTIIAIDQDGINYEQSKLLWNNIIDFGIVKTEGGRFNQNKIVLGTITKGIVEINLSTLNVTPEVFIEIIQLNIKPQS
jgi:hypothetical protein